MTFLKEYAGVIALVILAIMGVSGVINQNSKGLFGSTSCANITCLSGGLRLVTDAGGDFEADVASVFNGAASFLSTFKVGTNGTSLTRINSGQCYIKPYATTIAATSTALVDCQATALSSVSVAALTGVTANDNVTGSLSTSTVSTLFGGLALEAVSASTTPGYIQLQIANLTGATFTWPTTGVASGTASYVDTK